MRITRILCLVIVAALAAAMVVGVASAAAKATALCMKNEETCAKGNTYGSPTILANWAEGAKEAPGTYAKLVMPALTTVTCTHSKFQTQLSQSEGPLVGEVFKWWFLSCTSPSVCTMETGEGELPSYGAELKAVGGGDGKLVVAKPRLIVNCTGKFKCIYESASMEFDVEGATLEEGGAYTSSAAKLTKVSLGSTAFCPATAEFISHYRTLEPAFSLFVTYR
jgi:hypothetical protein